MARYHLWSTHEIEKKLRFQMSYIVKPLKDLLLNEYSHICFLIILLIIQETTIKHDVMIGVFLKEEQF